MKTLSWNDMDETARAQALQRPVEASNAELESAVALIIEQVRADGDGAVRALTRRFDGIEVGDPVVDEAQFDEARAAVPEDVFQAMQQARERLLAWHVAGQAAPFEIETAPGVQCGRILRGIRRVGLYVPAGTAPLPSTALMLGVPAALAGCDDIVLCTPPRPDGKADPYVLTAARLCGITRVYRIGGAQAIAAMAFGTPTIPACDKLFGPGNSFVTQAKQQVSVRNGGPAIDMPAGPSEVLVIADDGASPAFVASDLLSQAEHGTDSQVILLALTEDFIERVRVEIDRQLQVLPRADIARAALGHARLVVVEGLGQAFEISNAYAPEHLILALRDARAWLPAVRSAGSVFLGDHAPESLGDYCSGTNHVLPTNGAAHAYSGVSVASFQTSISVQSVTPAGLAAIGPCAVTLARAEGLEAHAQAVLIRLEASA
ncbi:MAG: histidinol dehydrogenase [Gammaproteobacteria bacterium]|nr:histidinol dehydrogenase [Gammaproteobacteria bacterium]